jgi:hypothetical protein
MLHSRLVSALKKAGASVRELDRGFSHKVDPETVKYDKHFEASLDGERIDWYTSENFNEKLGRNDGRLFVGFVTKRSPHTDTMTDCFCDSYRDTIKASVWLLNRKGY